MRTIVTSSLLVMILYIGIATVVFGKLPSTYFQQDEWAIFGNYLFGDKAQLDWFSKLFVYEQYTHLIPFSNIVSYLQFKFFGLAFWPYAVSSIVLHILASFGTYILTRKLLRNASIAFVAGLIFLVSSIHNQAVTWVATTVGTVGSTLFVLTALIFLHRHVESGKAISMNLVVSLLSFVISLGFKETSIFLFIFYPVFFLLTAKKRNKKAWMWLLGGLLTIGIVYTSVRLLVSNYNYKTQTAAISQELSQPAFPVYIYRLMTNPIKIGAQSVVPQSFLLSAAQAVVVLGYPQFVDGGTPDPYIVQTIASDIISFLIAAVFTGFIFFLYKMGQKKQYNRIRTTVLLSMVFIVTSSIPFLIIPGKAGYISLFDGRHLYMTNIFVSITVALFFYLTSYIMSKRRYVLLFVYVFLSLYLSYHALNIRRDLTTQVSVATLRRSILSTIFDQYPTLPERVIFYIESDKAYYGLPSEETIVPFQSGFGNTLLVWYNARRESFPACFFERKFLYVLLSEDYKECEGRGFGYYRKIDRLEHAVQLNKLPPKSVIAFRFSSATNSIVDITDTIRALLWSNTNL